MEKPHYGKIEAQMCFFIFSIEFFTSPLVMKTKFASRNLRIRVIIIGFHNNEIVQFLIRKESSCCFPHNITLET